jgi:hypothetical protein
MAVHKVIRSNPVAQPQRPRPNHQFKAEIFEVLRHLNRGYGVALAAFDKLETKDRMRGHRIFPAACLGDYRKRTEELRALVNHDLLLLFAGHEEQAAFRFASVSGQAEKRLSKSGHRS